MGACKDDADRRDVGGITFCMQQRHCMHVSSTDKKRELRPVCLERRHNWQMESPETDQFKLQVLEAEIKLLRAGREAECARKRLRRKEERKYGDTAENKGDTHGRQIVA